MLYLLNFLVFFFVFFLHRPFLKQYDIIILTSYLQVSYFIKRDFGFILRKCFPDLERTMCVAMKILVVPKPACSFF